MNTAEQFEVDPAPASTGPATAGQMLAAARHAQNLSVTDVANRLKLSVQQVEALEAGAYERLPGPVFVRGFTRNYARLLRLDADAVVQAVDASLPRAPADRPVSGDANIPMPAKGTRRWPVVAGVAAVVFLGAALVDVLWPEGASTTAVAPEPAPAVATPPAPLPPAAVAEAGAPAPVPQAPAPATGPVPATYQPESGGAERTLRFVFERQSWVQVRDASGKVVLEALYPAGSTRELNVRPPLTLIIGNAPGVKLSYGSREVDLAPHTRVAVARLTLE